MQKTPLQDLSNPIAREIAEGKSPEEIVHRLVERGWRPDMARNYINNLNEKYDLDQAGTFSIRSVMRTLAMRILYTCGLIIASGAICAIGLAMPTSIVGLILFATGVIVLSLGMVFVLLK